MAKLSYKEFEEEVKKSICKKATNLIESYENREKEKMAKETFCFRAGICPICGNSLKLGIQKKTNTLFGIITLLLKKEIIVCPNNCILKNINNKNLTDTEYLACITCINPILQKYYWKKLSYREYSHDRFP
jgi:hypothetical protein